MNSYTISELVDLSTIQKLAESHYEASGMPIGIVDAIDGSVLVGAGWQDICTMYHRAHPSSLRICQESDDYIKSHLMDGEACQYRCKNGLWDIGVPVMVRKRHLATIFLGQFFYEGESPDRDYFIRQAQQYGYDLEEYLAALDRVPVLTKEKVDSIITYNKSFSSFMAELAERSLSNLESTAKYRAIVENFDGLVYICSDDYRVEFTNGKMADRLGENPVGEFCYKVLHDRDSVCPWCVNERVFAGEKVHWEIQCPKDGRWYYIVDIPIHNADGSMSKQSMITDITERKRMEEELRRREQYQRTLIDNMPFFVWLKDEESRLLAANLEYARVARVESTADLEGKTDFDFFPRDLAEKYVSDDRAVMATRTPKNVEEMYVDENYERHWMETWKSPLIVDGQVVGTVGCSRDITKRKRNEESLCLNAERMNALLQLNQMTDASLDEITSFAFEAAVRVTRSKLGYLAFINEDETVMTVQLWSREAMAECKVPGPPKVFPVETTGLWGEAVRQRRPIITNDYNAANPWKKGTPEGHVRLTRHMNLPVLANGRIVLVAGVGNKDEDYTEADVDQLTLLMEGMWRLVERKRAEDERLARLRLVEAMDRVNRAIQGTVNLEQMMGDVLDVVLSIFDCDRAFLFYPCDPEASAWRIPMERTRPEYPGALASGLVMPMDEEIAETLRTLLNSDSPVKFGPGTGHPLPKDVSERFGFKSRMSMALYPKVHRPWQFGIHQCSYPRAWTQEEERILQAIGRRLEDGLTSLLTYRDLRESEARYRRIVDTATEGIWVIDQDDVTTFVNTRMAEMLGCSDEEMIGRPYTDFIFEEDRPDYLWRLENRLQGIPESYERRIRHKDGQTVWTHVSATPIFDDDHHFIGSFAMFTDITERKRAEEALREKTEELDRYFNDALDLLCIADTNGHFYRLNQQWESTLGFSVSELEGRRFLDFVHPDDVAATLQAISQLSEQKEVLNFVNRYRCKNGTYRWIEWRSFPSGTRIYAVARDITVRRRMEEELRLAHDELEKRVVERTEQLQKTAEELRKSEERYALAVQGSNDGIWDLNLVTGEAYHSPRWKSILGYEENELTDDFKEWEDRIHPDDYQRVMETNRAYLEGRIPILEIEHRLRHKDGSYRWVISHAVCLRNSDEKPYRMAGSLTDITERKKLEQHLLQAQKMESVGFLAGGVAHDFNNLLTAISGYGQILLETIPEGDELSQESIQNVLKAADRATELTRGLLAFSRKQLISPKPVHIDSLINNTGKLIQRIIGEDIEFSTHFHDINLLVNVDPGQIGQVLMNLASNARDAMPYGGRLSITTSRVVVEEGSERLYDLPSPGKYALISVADTGTGIDKKTMGNIFEPFFTTKEVGKGTGLGLAIVHGIIKQHNGAVLAGSEPGKGTTIDIYLPLFAGHAVTEESRISARLPGGMETLLVVEDDETVRVFIKKILERAGYKAIIACDGEEAVARFREHDDISLVLSDLVMPGINGRGMLNEIRKIKPGIKAIFISGYAADVMKNKGMFEEGAEFVTKPFKKNDLLQKVREVLDKC